jgi:hypothetical protein
MFLIFIAIVFHNLKIIAFDYCQTNLTTLIELKQVFVQNELKVIYNIWQ